MNRTHVHTAGVWNVAARKSPAGLFLSNDQTRAMVRSQLQACVVKSGGLASVKEAE